MNALRRLKGMFKRPRSQESGTTAATVAATLRSGDTGRIAKLMREHRITAGVAQGRARFHVEERDLPQWRPGRRLGWWRPHRIRTFNLVADAGAGGGGGGGVAHPPRGLEVDATYIPMTGNDVWAGRRGAPDLRRAGGALGGMRTVAPLPAGELAVTGALSGCSLVRAAHGRIGHLQPPRLGSRAPLPLDGVRAEQALARQRGARSVFGPIEYGRRRGTEHYQSNAILVGRGVRHRPVVVSQSLFLGDTSDKKRITSARTRL